MVLYARYRAMQQGPSPSHHERLVVVVIPQFPGLIAQYYQFIQDINTKWIDDLLNTQNEYEEPNRV